MIIGSKLYRCKESADSFQWVRDNLTQAPNGSIFIADKLTKARGRQGREWINYSGQLTVTILFKPRLFESIHPDDLSTRLNQLSMAISIGICRPLQAYGVHLKWPNDFFLNGKKCGGMLAQAVWNDQIIQGIIAGFSININNTFSSDDPLYPIATSIAQGYGQINMRQLYLSIVQELDSCYSLWNDAKWKELFNHWKGLQGFIGKLVTVHQHDGTVREGIMQQVLPSGDMLLLVGGKLEVFPFHQVGNWH